MAKLMFLANKGMVECSRKECREFDLQNIRGFETPAQAIQDGWAIYNNDWVCPRCTKDLMRMAFDDNPRNLGKCGLESDPDGIDTHAPGAKLDKGKIQAGVLGQFSKALLAVAEVGTHGAEKYSRGGWQHVENGIERYGDAGWRHKIKGCYEDLDPDSQLMHKAHEAWNILAELELILRSKSETS